MLQRLAYRLMVGQTLTVTPNNSTAMVRSPITPNAFITTPTTYGPYAREVEFTVDGDAKGVVQDYTGQVTRGATTVANLPSAASAGAGADAFVTDATSATFGAAAVGGGSNKVPVYCTGSGWFIG